MKILLLGNSGSGKDFAAKLFELSARIYSIRNNYVYSRYSAKEYIKHIIETLENQEDVGVFTKERFAQPVKDFIHQTFKIPYRILNSSAKDSYKITIKGEEITLRKLIIKISEEFKNIFGEDIWVDTLLKYTDKNKDWRIIVDGRFPNEFDRAKKQGFITIKIKSWKENKTDFGLNKISEIPEYKIDYILDNNESQLSLFKKIYRIYESEIKKENDNA